MAIGNPPYIRIQELIQGNAVLAEYYNSKFVSAASGNYDIYVVFDELGISILNEAGSLSYIQPNKFFNANYGKNIRHLLSKGNHVYKVVHFGAEQIFEEASTYTCLLFLGKKSSDQLSFTKVYEVGEWIDGNIPTKKIKSSVLSEEDWTFPDPAISSLMEKLKVKSKSLEDLTERIFQGLKTSADKIYILELLKVNANTLHFKCPMDDKVYEVEKELFYPLIKGGNSKGYVLTHDSLYILFPYKDGKLISEDYIKTNLPLTYAYLSEHKGYLENRENGKMKGEKWFGYVYPKSLKEFEKSKIFTPDIAPVPSFGLDDEGKYYFTGGVSGGYGILPTSLSKKALLCILNSKVTAWYIQQTSTQMRGGWYSFESKYIRSIPIPNLSKEEEIKLEEYADQILVTKSQNPTADTSALEKEIDQLVYQLYGLTEEEIKIVEGTYKLI